MTLEEDSGVTGEKQITDLYFFICTSKSVICFSPVPPESSSGSTQVQHQHPSLFAATDVPGKMDNVVKSQTAGSSQE